MSKRLADLNPSFVGHGGEGVSRVDADGVHHPVPRREGVALWFDCPCGCGRPLAVNFINPLDGGEGIQKSGPRWTRTGETFDDLTLSPSVLRLDGCGWHGWIRNGEVIDA